MKTKTIGITLIIIGVLIIIHHFITSGKPFDIQDMLHHEFFEAIFITAGITTLITSHTK